MRLGEFRNCLLHIRRRHRRGARTGDDAPADAPAGARVFNVCGGTRISLADAIELVRQVTGRPLRVEHEEAARGDARHTFGDHSRATRALGYRPGTSLSDGIEAQWRCARARRRPSTGKPHA